MFVIFCIRCKIMNYVNYCNILACFFLLTAGTLPTKKLGILYWFAVFAMPKDAVIGATMAVVVTVLKIAVCIFTPLYLDCLNPLHTILYNDSTIFPNSTEIPDQTVTNNTTPLWQRIDPFFGIWISMGFDTLLFGALLLILYLFVSGTITKREMMYPKRIFILSGACQAVSAVLYQFSTSGNRTPPYLQGALGYFLIPHTFILRQVKVFT